MRTLVVLLTLCMGSPPLCLRMPLQENDQAIQRDVLDLYSSSASTRTAAAGRLVAAGPSVVPAVLPVLCDKSRPNFEVAWRHAARVLGELKAEAAAPCLIKVLALGQPTLSVFKSEATIAEYDPAFVALIQIDEAAIPPIARALPSMHPDQSYLALRVLRVINTPSARAAVEAYIGVLNSETQHAKQVLDDFRYGPGLTR